jgi:hypothetical protein
MNHFRKTQSFFLTLLAFAACLPACRGEAPPLRPAMPPPSEFASTVLAGSTNPETFDFDTHGFWRLPKNEQMTWFAGVAEPLGFGKPAADGCAIDEQRKYAAMIWTILATQAVDATDWRLNALALRARLAELDAHLSKAAPSVPSEDPLTQELLVRFARDQAVRGVFIETHWTKDLPPLATNNWMPAFATRMGAIDCDNTAWLRKQLTSIGWFSIPKYGAEADSAAWYLVQHADLTRDFQREMLVKLEALPRGETDPKRIGYLWDRVALSEGRPQRYGTQGRCEADGTWKPFDSEDPAQLDERRKRLGMDPIAEHAKVVWREACPK